MTISLFIKNKEFHVFGENFENVYGVNESRELADNLPVFLKDAISKDGNSDFETVIYSAGPASFTTVRIINSLLKGLLVARPALKFVGVSNFLTYMVIASKVSSRGILAIPTMRGDYFTSEYNDEKLQNPKILGLQNIEKHEGKVFFDEDTIYNDINLSKVQKSMLNSNFAVENSGCIKKSLEIDYGFTPEYKH